MIIFSKKATDILEHRFDSKIDVFRVLTSLENIYFILLNTQI